jgi:multiple sugar transport system ATP-binding protein
MAGVTLRGISKSFGSLRVIAGVDLDIADGEFLTLVGPSGCGKSTLLRVIAGLEPQDAGTVAIGDTPVDHLRPHERKVAMVFQSYALYPHMTVFGNIALPLVMAKLTLAERLPLLRLLSPRRRRVMNEIAHDVRTVAAQLQIDALLDRRPGQLSGGQRQRVALGRAMVRHPHVFLMDEPLSNLDAKLRVHMRTELAELHKRLGATFIYVTHDQVEAMTMSSRVAVMDSGEILQLAKPDELYARPANLKVAQFIGSPAINLLPGNVGSSGDVEIGGTRLPIRVPLEIGSALTVGIRPESIVPSPARSGTHHAISARLRRSENLGSEQILYFDAVEPAGAAITCRIPLGDGAAIPSWSAEETVALSFDPRACHVFDKAGQRVATGDVAAGGHGAVARPRLLAGEAH